MAKLIKRTTTVTEEQFVDQEPDEVEKEADDLDDGDDEHERNCEDSKRNDDGCRPAANVPDERKSRSSRRGR